eukprot:TRINITY_DN4225_c0_g1_i1.p1 TRINITY_DN4225_c0_g1~~TRINITY_DN4225_c0_g1_i1.p1  ORF type:complete len:460 (-),score=87.81 TRINITY_DN4225_c0_g1_i1:112-1491(-)
MKSLCVADVKTDEVFRSVLRQSRYELWDSEVSRTKLAKGKTKSLEQGRGHQTVENTNENCSPNQPVDSSFVRMTIVKQQQKKKEVRVRPENTKVDQAKWMLAPYMKNISKTASLLQSVTASQKDASRRTGDISFQRKSTNSPQKSYEVLGNVSTQDQSQVNCGHSKTGIEDSFGDVNEDMPIFNQTNFSEEISVGMSKANETHDMSFQKAERRTLDGLYGQGEKLFTFMGSGFKEKSRSKEKRSVPRRRKSAIPDKKPLWRKPQSISYWNQRNEWQNTTLDIGDLVNEHRANIFRRTKLLGSPFRALKQIWEESLVKESKANAYHRRRLMELVFVQLQTGASLYHSSSQEEECLNWDLAAHSYHENLKRRCFSAIYEVSRQEKQEKEETAEKIYEYALKRRFFVAWYSQQAEERKLQTQSTESKHTGASSLSNKEKEEMWSRLNQFLTTIQREKRECNQ